MTHFSLVTHNSKCKNYHVPNSRLFRSALETVHLSTRSFLIPATPTGRFRNLHTHQTFVVAAVRLDELITRLSADGIRYSSERTTTAKAL